MIQASRWHDLGAKKDKLVEGACVVGQVWETNVKERSVGAGQGRGNRYRRY